LLLAVTLVAAAGACDRDEPSPPEQPAHVPRADELPPLELRDDTLDLLLTWIDPKGDFHVVQKPADVPKQARKQVRVVVATREEGTGRLVYVADLGKKGADGSYPVRTMTRAQWDELGASKRKARMEALTPSAAPPSDAGVAPKAEAGQVAAVVYGAEWCKPCHDAERYLKQRGVRVVYKDIEQSDVARKEMQTKLRQANMPATASIPIIDVGGRILIGYSTAAIDHAIAAAQASKKL
jgi:glutaredoxin